MFNSAGGWNGSGCAEIRPPTTGQRHTGLGYFRGLSESTLYIRFLIKIGPTYYSTARSSGYGIQNKLVIVGRSTGRSADRVMSILEATAGNYFAHSACAPDNVCYYSDGDGTWNPGNEQSEVIKYPQETGWVCLEMRVRVGGPTQITLTQADGTITQWVSDTNSSGGGTWSEVTIIGGYFNGYHISDANNHIFIDELVISNNPIGVPAGFIGSGGSQSSTRARVPIGVFHLLLE